MKPHTPLIGNKRRRQIKDTVLFILQRAEITTLPIDVFQAFEPFGNVYVLSSSYAYKNRYLKKPLSNAMTFEISTGEGKRYYVIYSDAILEERARWDLMHELGHITLGHDFSAQVDSAIHLIQEAEANYFAEQMLMPLPVFYLMGAESTKEIMETCHVSYSAASTRMRDLNRHLAYFGRNGYSKHDKLFIAQFRLSVSID